MFHRQAKSRRSLYGGIFIKCCRIDRNTEYEYDDRGNTCTVTVIDTSRNYTRYAGHVVYYDQNNYTQSESGGTGSPQNIDKPYRTRQTVYSTSYNMCAARYATYQYNAQGLVSSVEHRMTEAGTAVLIGQESCTYKPSGLPDTHTMSFTRSGSTVYSQSTSYTYRTLNGNTTGQIETRTSTVGGTSVTDRYVYDSRGNITEIWRSNVLQYQYSYDQFNRLITEANRPLGTTTCWTYDDAGNILTRKVYDFTTGNPSSSTLQATYTYSYGNSNWGDLLTSYNGQSITYDAIGNPTSYRGKALTWQGRRLQSMDGVTYTYDTDGIRLTKTVGNVTITYTTVGGKLLAEEASDASTITQYFYDASGNPVAMCRDNVCYYYATNLQGDIIALYAEGGTKICDYYYNAYGACTVSYSSGATAAQRAAAAFNPLRYRGYYYDTETGLYYLGSRYYDPETGRFLNADSVMSGIGGNLHGNNLFAYCFDNPVNMIDPTGHWPSWAKKLVAAVAVVAVVAAVAAITVATAGAGTAVAAVAVGAAKGAAVGFAAGAASGAAIGYVTTGTLDGTLDGMADGALSGAITGAITGGVKGYSDYSSAAKYLKSSGANPKDVLSTYKSTPKVKTLKVDTPVYRTWGGGTQELGHWISPNNYGASARSMLSLPSCNTAVNTSSFILPKGTTVLAGKAAPLFGQTGGGVQWWISVLG